MTVYMGKPAFDCTGYVSERDLRVLHIGSVWLPSQILGPVTRLPPYRPAFAD